jgi:hypothetical protein
MHIKHPNRFTVARARISVEIPLLLMGLSLFTVIFVLPLAVAVGLAATVVTWIVAVTLFSLAVAL